MKPLMVLAIGCGVVASPFLYVYYQHVQEDRQAEETIRRNQAEASIPGTKAFENAQAERMRKAEQAAEAALPPIILPPVQAIDLLNQPQAKVRQLLGATVASSGDVDTAGMIQVAYAKGRANKVFVRPTNYVRRRDETKFRVWSGFSPKVDEDTRNVGARTVQIVSTMTGASFFDVTDDVRELKVKLRKTFADFMQRTWRADGEDVNVRVRGAGNKILYIEWVGCNESQLDRFTNGALFERNKYEFNRVECDNGYSTASIDLK